MLQKRINVQQNATKRRENGMGSNVLTTGFSNALYLLPGLGFFSSRRGSLPWVKIAS